MPLIFLVAIHDLHITEDVTYQDCNEVIYTDQIISANHIDILYLWSAV